LRGIASQRQTDKLARQKQTRATFGAQAVGEKAIPGNVPILATQTQPLATGELSNPTPCQRTLHPMRQTGGGILALRDLPR